MIEVQQRQQLRKTQLDNLKGAERALMESAQEILHQKVLARNSLVLIPFKEGRQIEEGTKKNDEDVAQCRKEVEELEARLQVPTKYLLIFFSRQSAIVKRKLEEQHPPLPIV